MTLYSDGRALELGVVNNKVCRNQEAILRSWVRSKGIVGLALDGWRDDASNRLCCVLHNRIRAVGDAGTSTTRGRLELKAGAN